MIRRMLHLLIVLCAALLSGCAVHQWPEAELVPDEKPIPGEKKVVIPLRLEYAPDFYVWEHNYDPILGTVEEVDPSLDLFPDYPGTSSKYTNVVSRGYTQVSVKVFPVSDPRQCVVEQTFIREIDGSYDTDFELELDGAEIYNVVIWSHLLTDSEAASFYNYSDFNRVRIISDRYDGNTDYRDGYRGAVRIDAAEIEGRYVVPMKRPMGKFELVTTDLSEFLDRETTRRMLPTRANADDYRVIISFPLYYPNSYSVMEDRLENSTRGMSFETSMTVTGVSEASLGFDYVLLDNILDGGVQVRVDVYDLAGTRVAGSATFTVPMRRDHHTILRGAFLSLEGSGGVGIDPGFNGDHNVSVP